MPPLTVSLLGVGLLGPGLPGWAEARAVLAGQASCQAQPTVVPAPQRLPAAERRRAGLAIKLALAVAESACADAAIAPQALSTVFTSSSGDGSNCHALCEALAGEDRLISPTRFTNSVHNAAAGYWHIAVGNQESSTSLCAYDASFGAGLVEAVMQLHAGAGPLLLVASDTPYPEPLNATRPLPDSFGVALVLGGPAAGGRRLSVRPVAAQQGPAPSRCTDPALEALRRSIPAARALPLLEALAAERHEPVVIEYQSSLHLLLQVLP
ncbi:beta-ketoacyl synthase chain length factor [Aquabacterium sp. A7-Y]|uniref:beta-ketoacyl synthase chain length factor n=1 Tax=Aquabacterium sp. A7-Y TaxID=1349605 RepID=UPI00223DC76A|nr:beta-ketoacyl synthase chain length factor [Aquabacterium sp. A7-Y]MCW7536442.1 beta-ketoacyl synthase chain length factor [Aquabacterium sp. A7-Y]